MTTGAKRFEGRTAIVTGASRGIGLGIAQRIVDEGGRVCLTARNDEALQEAVIHLGGPDVAIGVAGKGDDIEHQDDAIARTLEAFGSVDHLVNNTGINPVYGRMIDIDLAAAHKIFAVNVLSALAWTQKVFHAWMDEHGGTVVNVASVAGLKPAPGIGFYGASKAMLLHVTEELAVELGPDVRVNAVSPAVVKTRFATALYEGREDEVAAAYPLKRLGVPSDIGSVVAFLLSEESGWMTGQNLVVDGGLTLTGGV
ncbi:SDR family oxidoreductase [Mumia zhuanghuii]|uniref:SDR family oxidoreductase n=1 Tax=Mumia zhuanghuii TaxID=2585211 RepID=A0A5C4MS36_9ACTN|nr:SDR family oxidoreductase [Mumia zhuanghuii]TNC23869.1 SDR family oxidoreductase [Mumia zhuanghuii]TNC46888.1 SDR family oxidoreductase [Mumia zhuanghuii]